VLKNNTILLFSLFKGKITSRILAKELKIIYNFTPQSVEKPRDL